MSDPDPLESAARNPMALGQCPPKPPLVFHVGVTGHRPDPDKRPSPDESVIRASLREVLRQIRTTVEAVAMNQPDLFGRASDSPTEPAPCKVRLLSSLAEGADLWATDEALDLGYELQAALPFSGSIYARDFQGAALEEHSRLVEQASVVFELDGSPDAALASKSYLAAGRQVIRQTDLLIAVWDGQEERGQGGTGQIVREALQSGVPVIWIRWTAHPESGQWRILDNPVWQLLERLEDRDSDADRLQRMVREILLPPDVCPRRCHLEPNSLRETYYLEHQPGWTLMGGFWNFFRGVVAPSRDHPTGKLQWPSWRVRIPPFADATEESWIQEVEDIPALKSSARLRAINRRFFPHFAWANQLSVHYGDLYRSSFVLNYLLGALAVALALLSGWALTSDAIEWPWVLSEAIVIGLIIITTIRGRRGRWHQRWLEYRTLAERLRLSRLMALTGGWRQQPSMPGHLAAYGDPVNSWVHWHYRAVERDVGLPGGKIDVDRLAEIKLAFHGILTQGQVDYHKENRQRLAAADTRLHRFGNGLFIATFIACSVHLAIETSPLHLAQWQKALLVGLNAFLPACGAALAAIRNQGEFHRLARRSEAMQGALGELGFNLAQVQLEADALKSWEVRRHIERCARLMLNETIDWRIVFQDRPLDFPA